MVDCGRGGRRSSSTSRAKMDGRRQICATVVVKSVFYGAQICRLSSILALKVKGQGRGRPLFISFIEPTKILYRVKSYQSLTSSFEVTRKL